MPNKRFNKQVPAFKMGGDVKKMGGGMSKLNPGLRAFMKKKMGKK